MQAYLNALTLKFDGNEGTGENAPTKGQVAVTWASVASLILLVVR